MKFQNDLMTNVRVARKTVLTDGRTDGKTDGQTRVIL